MPEIHFICTVVPGCTQEGVETHTSSGSQNPISRPAIGLASHHRNALGNHSGPDKRVDALRLEKRVVVDEQDVAWLKTLQHPSETGITPACYTEVAWLLQQVNMRIAQSYYRCRTIGRTVIDDDRHSMQPLQSIDGIQAARQKVTTVVVQYHDRNKVIWSASPAARAGPLPSSMRLRPSWPIRSTAFPRMSSHHVR